MTERIERRVVIVALSRSFTHPLWWINTFGKLLFTFWMKKLLIQFMEPLSSFFQRLCVWVYVGEKYKKKFELLCGNLHNFYERFSFRREIVATSILLNSDTLPM